MKESTVIGHRKGSRIEENMVRRRSSLAVCDMGMIWIIGSSCQPAQEGEDLTVFIIWWGAVGKIKSHFTDTFSVRMFLNL